MTLQENGPEYDSDGFFGRGDIVKSIIETLTNPLADQRRQRAILVEGPACRGKTWLLRRIHERILAEHTGQIAVGFFAGDSLDTSKSGQPPQSSHTVLLKVLVALWDVVHHYCPNLPWPSDIRSDNDETRFAKIAQWLQGSQPQTLLQLISEQIDAVDLPVLLLILDGMEEIDADVLKMFEFEFVQELFRNPRVRLLASRRVSNTTHQWRKPLIKQQNNPIVLEPFKSPEQQIEYLIQVKGASISFTDLKARMKYYTWMKPGANAFLFNCALDGIQHLSTACIRECLEYLMLSTRDAQPIDDLAFEYIRQMATLFSGIDVQGVARHKLNSVFGMSDRGRDEFLGQLQGRGIGYFGNGGNYILHSDFVELLREL